MAKPTVIVVDADQSADLSEGDISNINNQVQRAGNQDEHLFYVLAEGADLHEDVDVGTVSSVLRYDPKSSDPYDSARIDEQLTNRDVEDVRYIGAGNKPDKFVEKENNKFGRSGKKV